ncbi:MAG: FAD-dependent oxidoreductase [Bacteroidales bacterium]|nr:FAD-dependent oxidoreductase [Bacteroidales bacterium]
MEKIQFTREATVAGTYDVVVCGGGPAGFIAAIAAAREGAKTALIEQYGFLGGAATNSLVTPLSVFTYNGEKVIGGIPWEFLERLEKMGGGLIEKPLGNVAFDPELYKLCCQRMVLEAGIDLYLHSWLSGCQTGQGRISHVFIENKNGTEALAAKVFVDATGDADLAHFAGVPMLPVDRPLQPASTYFVLAGVDTESPRIAEAMHHNKQGVNCHCLPIREELIRHAEEWGIPDFGGPWFCTLLHPGVVAVNMTRTQTDACDNRDFTAAECRLREDVYKMANVLREHFPEFRNCHVSMVAPQAGVRETRRIRGVHVISGEEYVNGVRYPDSVSRGAHPIDIHAASGATQQVTFLKQPAYVPYRALVAAGFPNLLVAGRCISADRQAFASLRVQASCMGMGQAAGVAAAQAVQGKTEVNVLQLDTDRLASRLREIGACL